MLTVLDNYGRPMMNIGHASRLAMAGGTDHDARDVSSRKKIILRCTTYSELLVKFFRILQLDAAEAVAQS